MILDELSAFSAVVALRVSAASAAFALATSSANPFTNPLPAFPTTVFNPPTVLVKLEILLFEVSTSEFIPTIFS